MRTKIILTALFLCMFGVQCLNAQNKYIGSLNLNNKDKTFILTSELDTVNVLIGKKRLDFNNNDHFSFIKTKSKNYTLVDKYDTIIIMKKRKKIEYSPDISFFIVKKKSKQLVLKDKTGRVVLDADYFLKKGITDFNLTISDNTYNTGLLAYATYYLFNQSKMLKAAYDTPFIYFGY